MTTPSPFDSPAQIDGRGSPSAAGSASDARLAKRRILFIGGGNMADAMISGLASSAVAASGIAVIEPVAAARKTLQDKYGIDTFADANSIDAAARFHAIVLAVKPQQAGVALKAAGPLLRRHPEAVLLSIAAGIGIDLLIAMSGGHQRVVRAMPNTPSLIGEGISGLYSPADADPADVETCRAILAGTGEVVKVDHENLIDTVTAVSGSGPAYAFYLMEAMIEAGIAGGLDAGSARLLAVHTVRGAASLAMASDEPPEILRERVTSPAGTTAAAVAVLEQRQVKASIGQAIRAAAVRSQQLSDEAKAAQAQLST